MIHFLAKGVLYPLCLSGWYKTSLITTEAPELLVRELWLSTLLLFDLVNVVTVFYSGF